MKKVGELPWELRSYNTCEHHDRMFNFVPNGQRKLVVSEVFLGEEVEVKEVNTGLNCKCSNSHFFTCCPFGDKILVMAGEKNAADFFCALVGVDPGELTGESIHIEEKKVTGWDEYKNLPFLVQLSESKVWASFSWSDEIWVGELKRDELVMTKHPDHLPIGGGFGAAPLSLPDGRLVAAGGYPSSTSISLITLGEHFFFEKIGDMPGEGRDSVSTILIKERFVVGFGGWNDVDIDDMWIFDLRTRRASPVMKQGEWHPGTLWPVLVAQDKEIFVLGGTETWSAHCLSFSALSHLIQYGGVRCAFRSCLGLPFRPDRVFERNAIIDYAPNYL